MTLDSGVTWPFELRLLSPRDITKGKVEFKAPMRRAPVLMSVKLVDPMPTTLQVEHVCPAETAQEDVAHPEGHDESL